LVAGLANSLWTAIVGLAAVPFYLHYLGIASYGLIGFFAALQAVFGLLDMGLAPTINREVARSSVAGDRSAVRNLLYTLATAYWAIAGLIAVAIFGSAAFISHHWLNSGKIATPVVAQAVMLMGLVIACRFPVGLYMGALMGAQRMVSASAIEATMVTFANVGAIAVLALVSPTVGAFFLWQALAALLTVVVVRAAAWRALRDSGDTRKPHFDRAGVRRIWRFSAGMAVIAVLGTIFLQSDKIILSKIVSLADLGRYTIAALAARSLYLFMTPAFGAVYPRLTALQATGDTEQIKALYKSGTRLLMAVVFPVAAFVGVFSTEIITLWTGDAPLAQSVHVVVELLLLGTAFNAAMHFPYALQLAYGKSSLPVLINIILLAAFVPLLVALALSYGVTGAAAAWAILNSLYLLLGTWMTHRTILRGEGLRWIVADVGLPLLVTIMVVGAGGAAVQLLALNVTIRLLIGGLLVGAAFLLTVALSPALVRGARRLQVGPFHVVKSAR
jgi:O-antigen/teichoic acid export membrane protein